MNDFIVLHPLKKWYIVAANRWIIVAANPRYIYVRELTPWNIDLATRTGPTWSGVE